MAFGINVDTSLRILPFPQHRLIFFCSSGEQPRHLNLEAWHDVRASFYST